MVKVKEVPFELKFLIIGLGLIIAGYIYYGLSMFDDIKFYFITEGFLLFLPFISLIISLTNKKRIYEKISSILLIIIYSLGILLIIILLIYMNLFSHVFGVWYPIIQNTLYLGTFFVLIPFIIWLFLKKSSSIQGFFRD